MPFNLQIASIIATAGSNIAITASIANHQEVVAVVNLWAHNTGNVTIRNASILPPADIANIVRILRNRVTLEE
jgi:hypothetical protein